MVTIEFPALEIAGVALNPSVPGAWVLPTAFSGLEVSYGGDSCSESPGPGTMRGLVFFPEHHASFYPKLNDPAKFTATISGRRVDLFTGIIDDLKIRDVAGSAVPALIPNSRNMTDLSGWGFASTAAGVTASFIPGGSRVTASVPAATGTDTITVTVPDTPVTWESEYRLTLASLTPDGTPAIKVSWLDAASAVIRTDDVFYDYTAGRKGAYLALTSQVLFPPFDAVTARFQIIHGLDELLDPVTGIDGIALIAYPHDGSSSRPVPRTPGRWVEFVASDITATAARLAIGSPPWPAETVANRTTRLNALVPASTVQFGFANAGQTTLLGARDVDKQGALEVFARVSASNGDLVLASPTFDRLVIPADKPRYPDVLAVIEGTAEIVPDPSMPEVPAASIEAGPVQTSITDISNQVRIEYRKFQAIDAAEDASITFTNDESLAAYGPMARSIATDLAEAEGPAIARAQQIAAAADPFYRLADSVKLVGKQLPADPNLSYLYSAVEGFGRLVHITDGPNIIGQYHRVSSAKAVFGVLPSLELDIEPPDLAAPQALTIGDLGSTYGTMTIGQLGSVITIGDLKTTSALDA